MAIRIKARYENEMLKPLEKLELEEGEEVEIEVKKDVLRSGAKLNKKEINVLVGLFHKLRELEEEGKNRIWTRILKNSFAPLLHGK